jgi:xylose isomerase
MNATGYAARLNSFAVNAETYWPGKKGKPTPAELIGRAATVKGLTAVDLNFPDQVSSDSLKALRDSGLQLNGYAMRYYGNPAYKIGSFTNPDEKVRRQSIDLTKRGIDSLAEAGGKLMTLWMGQDGFDYSFQADYRRLWDLTLEAVGEVTDHNPAIDVSIEYKPNEPRAYALMPDLGMTLLACTELKRPNLGVTLDFCHVLYGDEMPAYAAALVNRSSRLLGLHLNDSYNKRDDGLMVASVHPIQTLELLMELDRIGYRGVIYFDTFPDTSGIDPVAEAARNVATVERLRGVGRQLLENPQLAAAIRNQDPITSLSLVQSALVSR